MECWGRNAAVEIVQVVEVVKIVRNNSKEAEPEQGAIKGRNNGILEWWKGEERRRQNTEARGHRTDDSNTMPKSQ